MPNLRLSDQQRLSEICKQVREAMKNGESAVVVKGAPPNQSAETARHNAIRFYASAALSLRSAQGAMKRKRS